MIGVYFFNVTLFNLKHRSVQKSFVFYLCQFYFSFMLLRAQVHLSPKHIIPITMMHTVACNDCFSIYIYSSIVPLLDLWNFVIINMCVPWTYSYCGIFINYFISFLFFNGSINRIFYLWMFVFYWTKKCEGYLIYALIDNEIYLRPKAWNHSLSHVFQLLQKLRRLTLFNSYRFDLLSHNFYVLYCVIVCIEYTVFLIINWWTIEYINKHVVTYYMYIELLIFVGDKFLIRHLKPPVSDTACGINETWLKL